MGGRIIVSGGGRLRMFECAPSPPLLMETPLPGSGALCADGERIFAASDEENVIYRLNARTLLPEGVCAGGPGMRALCLSPCASRLYVLLGDADSVLMLSGHDGSPLMLARVGVQPQNLRLDDTGERLVVAGGKDGCAHLLCARTLRLLNRVRVGEFCADAVCRRGRIRALRLSGDAAAPGRLIASSGAPLFVEPLTERLYARDSAGRWRVLCREARDAALIDLE